jgi:hypothetical protein
MIIYPRCSELSNHRSPHLADPPGSFPGAGYIDILGSHTGTLYMEHPSREEASLSLRD